KKKETAPTQKPPKKKSNLTYSEKQEFANIENEILKREKLKRDIENEMNLPEFHKQPSAIIKERQKFYNNLLVEIDSLYERWSFLEHRGL
nr:ABC transporter C-terminal domain-containing protein [bacterium]